MATPTIAFNNSTGSDTQGSGAGPSAVFGTAASFAGSVVTLDGLPDLSGVATDGSHVLFLDTDSGRKFFTINLTDNVADPRTVTVDDAPAGTSTGLTWAIGGKRSELESNTQLWSDTKAGWTVDFEYTGTDYESSDTNVITVAAGGNQTDGFVNITSSSNTRPRIKHNVPSATGTTITLSASYVKLSNLTIERARVATDRAAVVIDVFGGVFVLQNLEIMASGGASTASLVDGIKLNANSSYRVTVIDCHIHDVGGYGIRKDSGIQTVSIQVIGCRIADCGGTGFGIRGYDVSIVNNLITGSGEAGISLTSSSYGTLIAGNTIHGNDQSGILITSSAANNGLTILNNNITANGSTSGGYGIELFAAVAKTFTEDFNNFGFGATANDSGAISHSMPIGDDSLEVDPQYTSAVGDDYSVGANVKAQGFPDAARTIGANQSATNTFIDIGAAQREEPAGGGDTIIIQSHRKVR